MTDAEQAAASDEAVSLAYLVGRVNQGLRREMRRRLAGWGLSVPEFTALSILRRRPHLSNAQLARRSMVTPQTMLESLAALERRQLIQRESDPTHGRILRAVLTNEGGRVAAAAELAVEQLQDEVLRDVTQRERELTLRTMLGAMQRLRAGLDGD